MRVATIAASALLLLGAHAAHAQERIEVPRLDTEQRWARAASNLNAVSLALLQQGKEQGLSAEEVGTRMGTFLGPSWSSEPGTGTPEQFATGMAANIQSWPDAAVRITRSSDGAYTLRYSRPWLSWFGDDRMAYGISVHEFEAMFNAAQKAIGDYLGLDVEIRRDGNQWVETVRDAM